MSEEVDEVVEIKASDLRAIIKDANEARSGRGVESIDMDDVVIEPEEIPSWYKPGGHNAATIKCRDGSTIALQDATLKDAEAISGAMEWEALSNGLRSPKLTARSLAALLKGHLNKADDDGLDAPKADAPVAEWEKLAAAIPSKKAARIWLGCLMFRRSAGEEGNE